MHNQLENAIIYNRSGGRIQVATQSRPGRAILTVSNTGRTIRAEEVEDLFEPFRRLGADRIGTEGHHGLGLSIVRAVAQAHQADVEAAPMIGGGLTVTVSFPA